MEFIERIMTVEDQQRFCKENGYEDDQVFSDNLDFEYDDSDSKIRESVKNFYEENITHNEDYISHKEFYSIKDDNCVLIHSDSTEENVCAELDRQAGGIKQITIHQKYECGAFIRPSHLHIKRDNILNAEVTGNSVIMEIDDSSYSLRISKEFHEKILDNFFKKLKTIV